MKPRIIVLGQDNWSGTKQPMNCADRYRVFGPLVPMNYPKQSLLQRIFGRKG